VPAVHFARETLLNSRSAACLWKHPLQAGRLVFGALRNFMLPLEERLLPAGRVRCPVCDWRGRRFRNYLSADEVLAHCICPGCGSFDRHRHLVLGVRAELAERPGWTPQVMVGFSLSTAMRFVLEHEGLTRCYRSDFAVEEERYSPDFVADLRQAPLRTGSVDWLFCSHVLEHIPELDGAIDELWRVLRPGGAAWIQVSLEPTIAHSRPLNGNDAGDRPRAWQFAPDFGCRLERPGWQVTEEIARERLSRQDRKRYGIHPVERFWVVRKAT